MNMADYEKHPSYGMITVARTQGSGQSLFGSDALHNHTVHVEITKAEVKRDLSREWYYGKDTLVEFYMSEAQWARFVSSFGDGSGTPITLRHTEGYAGLIPSPPPPKPLVEPYEKDIDDRIGTITGKTAALRAKLVELIDGKKAVSKGELNELRSLAEGIQQELTSNLKFVADSFKSKLNHHVNDAMINFEAQLGHSLKMKGLEGLRQEFDALPEAARKMIPESNEPQT